ncbi:MAG: hypothetical protein NT002_01115 [candidate division Zixibacteria bacterium]|nr:hypothetical protein [candidate division Zixibacteria bacterium]
MGIKRIESRREFELMSLVDMMFLLLIFSFAQPFGSNRDVGRDALTITVLRENLQNTSDQLQVSMLQPFRSDTIKLSMVLDNNFYNSDSASFSDLCRPIKEEISSYINYRDSSNGVEPIRVMASDDAPFKIIDFIIRTCSTLKDSTLNLVPLRR